MYKIAISHAKHVPDFPCVEEGGVWDPVDPVYSGVGRAVTRGGVTGQEMYGAARSYHVQNKWLPRG